MFRGDMSKPLDEIDKSTLHGYLHVFSTSPEILDFPIVIKKLRNNDLAQGTGGSHGLRANFDNPLEPAISHEIRYRSGEQGISHLTQYGTQYLNTLMSGGMVSASPNDTLSAQVMKNYLSKRVNSGTSLQQAEKVFDDALQLEAMMTAMHEGGHAAHAAAMVRDFYGQGFDAAALKAKIDKELAAFDSTQKLKASRGVIYEMVKNQFIAIEEAKFGNSHDIYRQMHASGVDMIQISNDVKSGKTLTDLLNATDPSDTNRVSVLTAMIQGEAANGKDFHESLATFAHIAEWSASRDKRDVSGLERLANNIRNDSRISNSSLFYAIPLDSNGNIDTTAMFDPNKTINTSAGQINWHDGLRSTYFIRLKNDKYSYDGLTDDEAKKAQAVMEQLSGYAKMTKTYGAAYGNSNVESIAELNAAHASGLLDQLNIPASDMALINKLLNWLQRPIAAPAPAPAPTSTQTQQTP